MDALLMSEVVDGVLRIRFQREFEATGFNPFPTAQIIDLVRNKKRGKRVEKVILVCDHLKPFAVNVVNGLVALDNWCRDRSMVFKINWNDPSVFYAQKLSELLKLCKCEDLILNNQ